MNTNKEDKISTATLNKPHIVQSISSGLWCMILLHLDFNDIIKFRLMSKPWIIKVAYILPAYIKFWESMYYPSDKVWPESMVQLEVKVKESQEKLVRLKNHLEESLSIILPQVKKAHDELSKIDKKSIQELRSMPKPPRIIIQALTAVFTLLNDKPNIDSWASIKKEIAYEVIQRLANVSADTLPLARRQKFRGILNQPDFNIETLPKTSKSAASLLNWGIALVNTADRFDQDKPVQVELQTLEKVTWAMNQQLQEHPKYKLEKKFKKLKEVMTKFEIKQV